MFYIVLLAIVILYTSKYIKSALQGTAEMASEQFDKFHASQIIINREDEIKMEARMSLITDSKALSSKDIIRLHREGKL